MDERELRKVEPCGKTYGGLLCVLPVGHDGKHEATIKLPADVGQMIDAHIEAMENAERHYKKARRWFYVAAGLNLSVALWAVLRIVL